MKHLIALTNIHANFSAYAWNRMHQTIPYILKLNYKYSILSNLKLKKLMPNYLC
jgi:hypothetical protein